MDDNVENDRCIICHDQDCMLHKINCCSSYICFDCWIEYKALDCPHCRHVYRRCLLINKIFENEEDEENEMKASFLNIGIIFNLCKNFYVLFFFLLHSS